MILPNKDGGCMKTAGKLIAIILCLAVFLSACSSGLSNSSRAQQTAYARTIAVIQTSITNSTPTAGSAELTQTAFALTPTLPQATATPTKMTTIYPSYLAGSIGNLTIKDGTSFAPGEKFTMTWLITNKGTGTWTPDFRIVYVKGDSFSAPADAAIKKTVKPGETAEISIDLVAPTTEGTFTSYFLLQTNYGVNFGYGDSGKEPFYLTIVVATPFTVSNVSVSASPSSYTGACPVTIRLHAKIEASAAGTVTFHFMTSAGDLPKENVSFVGTGKVTSNGTDLTVSSSGDISVDVYIDSPNHQLFKGVVIPVNCS
jgi:hypothetical protein